MRAAEGILSIKSATGGHAHVQEGETQVQCDVAGGAEVQAEAASGARAGSTLEKQGNILGGRRGKGAGFIQGTRKAVA
jgi:hypothetical protein